MISPELNSIPRQDRIDEGFFWLEAALTQRGNKRKLSFQCAMLYFKHLNLIHHAKMCEQLAQGKRYYPRIINPSL